MRAGSDSLIIISHQSISISTAFKEILHLQLYHTTKKFLLRHLLFSSFCNDIPHNIEEPGANLRSSTKSLYPEMIVLLLRERAYLGNFIPPSQ